MTVSEILYELLLKVESTDHIVTCVAAHSMADELADLINEAGYVLVKAFENEGEINAAYRTGRLEGLKGNFVAGDVDWGTSYSDCLHKNFPCEHCGANLGEAWEEGF